MTDPYTYPGSDVLRNKLDLTDPDALDRAERRAVTQRIREGCPNGDFDLAHLRAIHRHLFGDVYDWAGEVRTVEINKGGSQFMPRSYIERGMVDVHRRVVASGKLRGLDRSAFATEAGTIIGDVNYVHPFREGNGRTQIEYLRQLAGQAGHRFEPAGLDPDRWIAASKAAHLGKYEPMAEEIRLALVGRARARAGDKAPQREEPARNRRQEPKRGQDRER